jgi:hypothetical protein
MAAPNAKLAGLSDPDRRALESAPLGRAGGRG